MDRRTFARALAVGVVAAGGAALGAVMGPGLTGSRRSWDIIDGKAELGVDLAVGPDTSATVIVRRCRVSHRLPDGSWTPWEWEAVVSPSPMQDPPTP